jgi:hypothetical protein
MRLCSSGIRFFSPPVLTRDGDTLTRLRPQITHRLPAVRSVAEVQGLLTSAPPFHHPVYCPTVSRWGLRLHEARSPQGSALDGQRLQVHGHRGQGAQDRSGPVPTDTLALLRTSWQPHRHQPWRLPATGRDQKPSASAASPLRRSRGQGAFRQANHRAGSRTTGVALPTRRYAST